MAGAVIALDFFDLMSASTHPSPAGRKEYTVASPFDLDELLERIGGDRELLAELVEIFEEESGSVMAEMRRCLDASDPEGVERAAHRLRGSVGSLGARAASDAALTLETMGRERDLSRFAERFAHLENEMSRLGTALMPYAKEHTS
ncbi:MAG: Hpt domain-containing protein [Acidobacteriota bacterium]